MQKRFTNFGLILFMACLTWFMLPEVFVQAEGTLAPTEISNDTVWTKSGSPYTIKNTTKILPNVKLKIEPGVVVLKGSGSFLNLGGFEVYGELEAIGTKEEPIQIETTLMGYHQDGIGSHESIYLEYVNFKKPGHIMYPYGKLTISSNANQLTIKNSAFDYTNIYVENISKPVFIENNFFDKYSKVSIFGEDAVAPVLFKRNTFYDRGEDYQMDIYCPNDCENGDITITENNFSGKGYKIDLSVNDSDNVTYNGENNFWGYNTPGYVERAVDESFAYCTICKTKLSRQTHAYKPFLNDQPFGVFNEPSFNNYTLTDQDELLKGRTEADALVSIMLNWVVLGQATADSFGNFEVKIPKQKAGDVLTAVATDSHNRRSGVRYFNTMLDRTPPLAPVVNLIHNQSASITGVTEPNASLEVKKNGTLIPTTLADQTGYFMVPIATPFTLSDIIEMRVKDYDGNYGTWMTVPVRDYSLSGQPQWIGELTDRMMSLDGTGKPGSTIKLMKENELIASSVVKEDGSFSLTWSQGIEGNSFVNLLAEYQDGYKSEPVIIRVRDTTSPSLLTKTIYSNERQVTGRTEPGLEVIIYHNNVYAGYSLTNADGTFTATLEDFQESGEFLEIRVKDKSGNITIHTTEVMSDSAPWLKLNEITSNSKAISGKTPPLADISIEMSGEKLKGKAGADGSFSINIPVQLAGIEIKVTATSADQTLYETRTVEVVWTQPFGWYTQDGYKYYFDSATGKHKTGWFSYNSKWYYFAADGKMQIGWRYLSGKWYYLQADGVMKTGWLSYNGKWYYFPSSGAMQTGWLTLGTKKYYFATSGIMQTGWVKLGTSWYYFTSGGSMQTGWLKLGSYWYYFNTNGVMQTGTITISGKRYTFNSNGVWIK